MSKSSKKPDSDPPSDGSTAVAILEEGIEIQHTKAYGVGIDCHSRFIQVSVIVKRNLHTYEYRFEFGTDLPSLEKAREKTIETITAKSDPPVPVSANSLHYCIESTSTYHLPVINIWKVDRSRCQALFLSSWGIQSVRAGFYFYARDPGPGMGGLLWTGGGFWRCMGGIQKKEGVCCSRVIKFDINELKI